MPLELGGPLLGERRHTFPRIFGAHELQKVHIDVMYMVVELLGHAHTHESLGRLHGQWSVGGNVAGQLCGKRHKLIVGHHMGTQAQGFALVSTQIARRKKYLCGFLPAYQAGQNPGDATLRHNAALHRRRG